MVSSSFRRPGRGRIGLQMGMVAVTAIGLVGLTAVSAQAALPAGPTTTGVTGSRPSATNLSFGISDRVSARVDVATGNLLVTTSGLSLPGVNASVPIGASYNSLGYETGSASTPAATGWAYNIGGGGTLTTSGANPVYVAPDGATWQFTLSGSTYSAPAALPATLTHDTTANTWTLTLLKEGTVVVYDVNGNPQTITDKNKNVVTPTFTGGLPTKLATTVGSSSTTANSATFNYVSSYDQLVVTQSLGSNSRSVTYQKDATGTYLTSFKDALGNTTSFTYTSGVLTKIISTTGAETDVSYNATGQVSEVDQLNTTPGSPGTSTTRLTYPSTSQTLVAGPDTNTSVAVAAGSHITYTINPTQNLVQQSTDAMGRVRAATYNTNSLPLTQTSGASGATGTTTTTAQYNANSGNSLTNLASPGGSSTTATYNPSPAVSAYNPATITSDSGSGSTKSSYTYDGQGNQLTQGTTAGTTTTVNATVTRNGDGTVATANSAGNGTNNTIYTYTSHQLTGITPVTGSSLGTKAFTYDWAGRLATETDGNNHTTSYTYDNNDHQLTTSFSDTTGTVTNTYDKAGNLLTQVSTPGTETNTYDQLNQLTSTVNTAGGGTVSYGYDQASNETSTATTYGTWTNTFDASGVLLVTKYPKGASFAYTDYATDVQGRRTDTFLQANATYTNSTTSTVTLPTVYAARVTDTYDGNGRVGEVKAVTHTSGNPETTTFDTQYCHNSASTTSCSTATSTDHSTIQWSKDLTTGQLTQYTYSDAGRILTANQSGGSNGNTNYTYAYDARGNRTSATATGTNPSTQSLTYNAANQVTTTGYTYDGAGNLISTPTATYTYNAAEQMTTSKKTATGVVTSYTYAGAAQNEVLSEATAGGTTYNVSYGQNDAQGQPEIVQYSGTSGGSTLTGNLFADPTTGQASMLTTSSDIACLYVYDGLDNPVGLITDFATNVVTSSFDPYGVGTLTGSGNGAAQNPYSFHSGIQDRASGLVKFGIRWYNPVTGTWTQQDTLDAPLDPANGNRYVFVGGDPINGLDPTGQSACSTNGAIAATFVTITGGLLVADAIGAPTIIVPVIGLPAAGITGAVGGILGVETLVDCSLGL